MNAWVFVAALLLTAVSYNTGERRAIYLLIDFAVWYAIAFGAYRLWTRTAGTGVKP